MILEFQFYQMCNYHYDYNYNDNIYKSIDMVQCTCLTQKGTRCSRESLSGEIVCGQHSQSGGGKTRPIISGITLFLMQQYIGVPIDQVNDVWKYATYLSSQYVNQVSVNELLKVVRHQGLTDIHVYHDDSFSQPDPQIIKMLAHWLRLSDSDQIEWEMKAQLMLQSHLFGK
jgi:hypothetical protein